MSDTPEKNTKPKHQRLNAAQKRRIIAMWESGNFTLIDIAEDLGTSKATIHRLLKKEGIEKGAAQEEARLKVQEEMARKAEEEARKTASRISETKDGLYRVQKFLDDQMMKEIVNAIQENRGIATVTPNIKALKLASEQLKMSRETRWKILGLDKDDVATEEIPVLSIDELTEDEMKEIREAQESHDTILDKMEELS